MLTARASSQLTGFALVLGAFVAAAAWMGCAGNGDPPTDQPGTQTPTQDMPSTSTPSSPDEGSHPAFEAGFQDASLVDPTPDSGDTCVDKDDPGASENTAKALPDTTDAQNDPIVVKGILNGPVDVDFYSLKMSDTFGHSIGVDLQDATADTEMCVFMRCVSGTLNFNSCTQGVQKTSDIGDKGCCTAGPGKAIPDWSCGGITQSDDSAQFYFRLKQTGTKACLNYSFSYAF